MTTEPIRNQTKSTDIDPNRMPWEPCQDKKNTIWGLSLSWAGVVTTLVDCDTDPSGRSSPALQLVVYGKWPKIAHL